MRRNKTVAIYFYSLLATDPSHTDINIGTGACAENMATTLYRFISLLLADNVLYNSE